jgi:cell division protease FtsH
MSQRGKTIAIWAVLLVLFLAFYSWFSTPRSSPRLVRADTLRADLEAGKVRSAMPDSRGLTVSLRDGDRYRVQAPLDPSLTASLIKYEVPFEAPQSSSSSWWQGPWLTILVVLGVLALFVLWLRRASGQSFLALRKTTARLVKPPDIGFRDVGGAPDVKERLADVIDFLKRPQAWEAAGAQLPKGILLEGPPGTGKTLIARALAGEAKVPFFEVSASEFVEMLVGVGAARVRDLFEQAAKKAPAVVFIDELDAVGRRRGTGAVLAGHQEREQTLNQLLVSLDGFQKRRGVVLIAATNRADILDAALLRPGRFDLRFQMGPLSETARAEVLAIHLRSKPGGTSINVLELARQTEGCSGAELAHFVNEAALRAVRRSRGSAGAVAIERDDFAAPLAAHQSRRAEFDALDAVLVESLTQMVQPAGRVVLRASLADGAEVSGELLWADPGYFKVRSADGASTTTIARGQVRRIEALAGTAPARLEEIAQDRFARLLPESA